MSIDATHDATGGGGVKRIALFEYGFRPFFSLAALYGALALGLWLATWFGTLDLPAAQAGALWHGHEMVFGFATAGLAGFLLTATPSWTGGPALRGVPLALLALV